MKLRYFIFLFITFIFSSESMFAQYEKIENDSVLVVIFRSKLSVYDSTKNVEILKPLPYYLLSPPKSKRFSESKKWKEEVKQKTRLFLELINLLADNRDLNFDRKEIYPAHKHSLFPKECMEEKWLYGPPPPIDSISDFECQLRYQKLLKEHKVLNKYNWEQSQKQQLYEEFLRSLKGYFFDRSFYEDWEFPNSWNYRKIVSKLISEVLDTEEKRKIISRQLKEMKIER